MIRNSLCVAGLGFGLVCGTLANQAIGQEAACATTSTTTSDAAVCGGCPCKGDCDGIFARDLYVPSSLGEAKMRIRVNINYFNSGMASTINAQKNKIVDDLAAHNIELVVNAQFRDDADYQTIDSQNELEAMRSEWADTTKLNIYVAALDLFPNVLGKAVFPWDADALTAQGGVLVDVAAYGGHQTTMTHEIGHALGLWHTHHGTELSEMTSVHGACYSGLCSCECYESTDCSPYCDVVGDYCSDTPPTPGNYACEDPGGEELCTPYEE